MICFCFRCSWKQISQKLENVSKYFWQDCLKTFLFLQKYSQLASVLFQSLFLLQIWSFLNKFKVPNKKELASSRSFFKPILSLSLYWTVKLFEENHILAFARTHLLQIPILAPTKTLKIFKCYESIIYRRAGIKINFDNLWNIL